MTHSVLFYRGNRNKILKLFRAVNSMMLVLAMHTTLLARERDIRTGYFVEVIGYGGKVVETVGTFLDFDQAREAEKRWNEGHKDSLDLTRIREGKVEVKTNNSRRITSSEPELQQNRPSNSAIRTPQLKWVDPPEAIANDKNMPSLLGKKGVGRIGKYKASIVFSGADAKGDFIVDGEIKGKGQWVQLGPYVQLSSETSKYQGKIGDGRIEGTRRNLKTGEQEVWSFDLMTDSASRADDSSTPDLKGTSWVNTPPPSSDGYTAVFQANGRLLLISPDGQYKYEVYSWRQSGNKVYFKYDGKDENPRPAIINGDELNGTPFGNTHTRKK